MWIAAAAVAVVAGVVLWQSQQTPALTARDTVVLSEFRNTTGDTMFDDTLSQALAVQLRQSPFINILPEQQVEATLQMMGRPATEPLTSDVAREICVRTGAKAMLAGTIAAIGNQYLLTLSAEDCVNGGTLAEEAVNAAGKDAVLASLGLAATAFREKLGESLASVQRYDQNIEQATTRSLEALKAYSQGMTTRRTLGDLERGLADYSEAFMGFAINQAITGRFDEARRQMGRSLKEREFREDATDEVLALAGMAALRLQQWDEAARVLGAVVDFGPRLGLSPMHAVTRVWLARAHAGAGRHAEARKAYDEAFAIWKDADPDLPLLVEARSEYQRLSS